MDTTTPSVRADSPRIEAAVMLLLGASPTTTTKDVKDFVRGAGYLADQADVSAAMQDMYSRGELTRNMHPSGKFWVYEGQATQGQAPTQAQAVPNTPPAIESKVFGAVSAIMDMPSAGISRATTFADIGADSLDAVEIIMEVEKATNVAIPDDVADKLRTVGDLCDYVQMQMAVGLPAAVVAPVSAAVVVPAPPNKKGRRRIFPTPLATGVMPKAKDQTYDQEAVVAFVKGKGIYPAVYPAGTPSNHARTHYACEHGLHKDVVRARRVRSFNPQLTQ